MVIRPEIQECGKAALPFPVKEDRCLDLQDILIVAGIVCAEAAAAVIWWPAALILAALFCFGFAYLIEVARAKEKKLGASRS
jgi:hypothetical protein